MEKRLHKSSYDRKVCGVCGGIGEYFNIDPVLVRVITAVLICGWGSGLLLYIILAIVLPEESEINYTGRDYRYDDFRETPKEDEYESKYNFDE